MSFTTASIIGLVLESLLYGIFIPLFLAACYVQWQRWAERHTVHSVMLFTTAFYGLTITAHWALSFTNGLRGIFFLPPGEDSDVFFGSYSNPLFLSKVTMLQFELLVADCIMVYRMYHIYNKNITVCVLPLIGSLIHLVVILGITIQTVRTHGATALGAWATTCFSVTTFNGLYTLSFISTRLWRTHNRFSRSGIHFSSSIVTRTMHVFIESAVLWTIFPVTNFIMYLTGSSGLFTTLDVMGPVIGISFCLIIVRLGQTKQHFSLPTITIGAFSMSRGTSGEDLEQGHETNTQSSKVGRLAIA